MIKVPATIVQEERKVVQIHQRDLLEALRKLV
jgi:hypothetical protein